MVQQVGNCNRFTPTHYLANVFAMYYGPRASTLCVQHCIQQIFFLYSKSIDLPISTIWLLKFDLENLKSKSWVMSKFKLTNWIQHPIDSHPFVSMSIHPLVPMIELIFKISPSKSKVKVIAQDDIVGITSYRMHCGPIGSPLCIQHCIQLTCLSFQVNRPSHS